MTIYLLLRAGIPQKKWSSHHGQQKSPKCSTWVQSEKRQNDLCSFPRQTIQYQLNVSLSELREIVMNREAWRAVIHGVAKSRTWLSDWTELNWWYHTGWHHWLNAQKFVWTPGVGDGQGSLACCNSWGPKESYTTEQLNWTELTASLTMLNSFAVWITT